MFVFIKMNNTGFTLFCKIDKIFINVFFVFVQGLLLSTCEKKNILFIACKNLN